MRSCMELVIRQSNISWPDSLGDSTPGNILAITNCEEHKTMYIHSVMWLIELAEQSTVL